ncbi:chaperonin 10-like protein [Tricladium varicosporioides]|nr:chaperonin 10-like protein [Hymenoscyphus varicosporioides]
MATQKAVLLTETGKPLKLTDIPIPQPKENEILIKLTALGLAPLDTKLRDHNIFNLPLPAVLGGDLAGSVVKNGPNTSQFPVGSHVFAQCIAIDQGGLQEYAIVDARFTMIVPKNISDLDAVLFPINAFTSACSLFDPEQGVGLPFPGSEASEDFDYKSQRVVVIGGGTNTGKLGIMMLKIAGVGMIVTTASMSGAQELKGYGATHVIDRKAPDVNEQILKIVGKDLIYVYDTFSAGDALSASVALLSNDKKGRVVSLRRGEVSDTVTKEKKAGFETKRTFGAMPARPQLAAEYMKVFPKWVEGGEIRVLKYGVVKGLDADGINAVLDGYITHGERHHVQF